MTILLIVLHVIVCLILISVILLQVGKGHGLSGASFGGSGVQSIFGMKTSNFLSKATTIVAVLFVLTTITLDIVQAGRSRSLFQPGAKRGEGQIDMEKMKAALEKIKVEAQRQEATARTSSQEAKGKVESVAQAMKTTGSSTAKTAADTIPKK